MTQQTPLTVTLPYKELVAAAGPPASAGPVRGQFAMYGNSKLFLEPTENVSNSRFGSLDRRRVVTARLTGVDTGSLTNPLSFTLPNPEVSDHSILLLLIS